VAARWPFLDHPAPLAFAHRGGAGDWPENTMPAFENAVSLGYRYLETDVHATADGVLVAFHDDHLDRVTDRTGLIGALPWSEVRRARVGGEAIPLLEDLLRTWPDVRVNIDPKHDAAVDPLVAVLERTGAGDRVCVSAFSDARLARFRRLTANRVCTGSGPREIARVRIAAYGVPTGRTGAACVQVPVRHGRVVLVDRRVLAAAHRRDLPVHGIMTDRPAVLKDVLQRRGQWVA
jgi:glycerophosphoryl diester phosphodiesterase